MEAAIVILIVALIAFVVGRIAGKRAARAELVWAGPLMRAIQSHPDWVTIRLGEAIKAADEWRENFDSENQNDYQLNNFTEKARALVCDRNSRAALVELHRIAAAGVA